jgi:predicted cobalt transporter CbtA
MLAGVIAGVLVFVFAHFFGEPLVDQAIAFEEAAAQAAGEAAEPELVSRATQAGLGLFTGVMAYAIAVGGPFALAFAFVHGRFSRLSARGTSAVIALAAFGAIVLVPAIKYPANPPAVGIDDTIVWRTQLFFAMIAMAIAAMIVAVMVAKASAGTRGAWDATLLGSAVFVGLVVLAGMLMPTLDEVPANFPADVLAEFRMASLAIQATLWTTLGLVFGRVADSVLHDTPRTLPSARAPTR